MLIDFEPDSTDILSWPAAGVDGTSRHSSSGYIHTLYKGCFKLLTRGLITCSLACKDEATDDFLVEDFLEGYFCVEGETEIESDVVRDLLGLGPIKFCSEFNCV